MYFVWISEQTAIISLYSINWLVFMTDGECLLRGKNLVFQINIIRIQPETFTLEQAMKAERERRGIAPLFS